MRVLICGGRDFENTAMFADAMSHISPVLPLFTLVIEGGATGADTLARRWAEAREIPVWTFPADWKRYGPKAAGPVRNRQMLEEGKPEALIAFPGGSGTADMLDKASRDFNVAWLVKVRNPGYIDVLRRPYTYARG